MLTMVEIELMNSESFRILNDSLAYVSCLARFIPQRTLNQPALPMRHGLQADNW